MKGNTDCHIPNDDYRKGHDRIFGKRENTMMCAGCGKRIAVNQDELETDSLCPGCTEQINKQGPAWGNA